MRSPSLSARLRYAFDNSMSRGTPALVGWLAVATLAFLVVMTGVIWGLGLAPEGEDGAAPGVGSVAWIALMRAMDAGALGGDSGSVAFLASGFVVTLGGIFILSTLIGVLNSGVEARLDELRKGRSQVIESGHTVILNWSPHLMAILSELVTANENQRRACVVILADREKAEMEDAIREALPDLKSMRVVCRRGSPMELADLDMVSVQTSRSIIALAPEDTDDPDADVIKAVLAITNGPNRREARYQIVAEIHEPTNLEAARLVGRDETELVLVGDVVSRIMVQTCRQSGLSVVYTELLDFGGDEIYFKEEPALVGKTLGDALLAFETSSVLGVRLAKGGVRLNPPMDTVIAPGDKLIVISQDDDTIVLASRAPPVDPAAVRVHEPQLPSPERTLVLGWNWKGTRIVGGLDAYVPPGSTLDVLTELDDVDAAIRAECPHLHNLTVTVTQGDTTSRARLEAMDLPSYDHIILLCSDTLPPQRADSRVLVTLLHLREIGERAGKDLSIVSEMLDARNRALAEVTKADDYIVSEKLVSLLLAQVAENRELNLVFSDLFDPAGSEIYIKPVADYVATGSPVSFATVVDAARRRGEIAIGYRVQADAYDASRAYGVRVNPPKSDGVNFNLDDRVIVLAES